MKITLGDFHLTFDPSGKLAQLTTDQSGPLLDGTAYRMDVGPSRHFEPRGWDECFPTIEPFEDSPVMGDLVAAAPAWSTAAQQCRQEWRTARYTATRTFHALSSNELEMIFSVQSHITGNLKFLWASHAIFSTQGLQRVTFPDRSTLDDFTVNGTSRKSFKSNHGRVCLRGRDCEIHLQTDQPWWGVWNNRGGWPEGRPAGFGCLGIEATNCDADIPQGAVIPPGGRFEGRLQLKVMQADT